MNTNSYFRWAPAILRFLLLIGTSIQAVIEFAAHRLQDAMSLPRRAEWLHRSCVKAVTRLGITLDVDGSFPSRGLLVCNHLSYIDVLALSAIAPCVFVAKRQVRSWPLFGRLARFGATIFVDRDRPSDTGRASTQLARALAAGIVVVLFPEATSSNGSTVLAFRSALFQPAVQLNQAVSTAHISYAVDGGSVEQDVCYWGRMVFLPHLLRLLRLRNVTARIRFGPEANAFADRKVAASSAREQILKLAYSWNPRTPMSLDSRV
jgi:1-acyl-sn-glycerol-3-phosphate acyltransferase